MPPNKTSFRIAFCWAAMSATFCFGSLIVLMSQRWAGGFTIYEFFEADLVMRRIVQGALWLFFAIAIWHRSRLAIVPIGMMVCLFLVGLFMNAGEIGMIGAALGSPGLALTFVLAMGLVPAILLELTIRAWVKGMLT